MLSHETTGKPPGKGNLMLCRYNQPSRFETHAHRETDESEQSAAAFLEAARLRAEARQTRRIEVRTIVREILTVRTTTVEMSMVVYGD